MATINITVEDHSIRVDNLIELAQGSNNFDTCAFTFDSSWDGFTLYASMYQNPKNVFKLPLDESNTCKIPVNVLQKSGWLYIGARGEKDDETIGTSIVVKLPVRNGAVNGNETGQEMLDQSQYEYLLGKVNELNEKCESLTKELENDFSQLSEDIADLKQNGTGSGTGWTNAQIDLLDEIGNYLPFTSGDGGKKWDDLIASLRGGASEEPDTPTDVTLTSISATYTGGEVASGTDLSSLTGITVTAHYSNGSTSIVTGYTLSGEILEGENIITVSYSGKTTTFAVTGIAESGGGDTTAELITSGLAFDFDFRNVTMESYNLTGWGNVKRTVDKTNNALLFGTSDASGDGIGIKYGFRDNRVVVNKTKNFELGTSYTVHAMYKTAVQKAQPNLFNWGDNVVTPGRYKIYPKYLNIANELKTANGGEVDYTNTNEPYIVATYIVEGSNLKVYLNDYLMLELNGSDYEGFAKWQDYGAPNEIYNDDYVVSYVGYNRALTNAEMIDNLAYFKTLEVA